MYKFDKNESLNGNAKWRRKFCETGSNSRCY